MSARSMKAGKARATRTSPVPKRLMAAAERLFAESSWEAVSVRSIVAAAGVNLAALNYHFGSKQELLREIFVTRAKPIVQERIRRLEEIRKRGGTPRLEEILEPSPADKYTLTPHLWQYLQDYAAKHKAKGNGFGFGIADPGGVTRTLSARYFKDGSEILIGRGAHRPPRRLTPRECARLMGFDQWCEEKIVVSDTQAYRQFGNAVAPKVVEAIGREILYTLQTI